MSFSSTTFYLQSPSPLSEGYFTEKRCGSTFRANSAVPQTVRANGVVKAGSRMSFEFQNLALALFGCVFDLHRYTVLRLSGYSMSEVIPFSQTGKQTNQ